MNNNFKYHTGIIGYPILFVILIWLIFWIEFRFNVDLKSFGIQPRKIEGIYGIMLMLLLHGDTSAWTKGLLQRTFSQFFLIHP